jgi:hypothetical protein
MVDMDTYTFHKKQATRRFSALTPLSRLVRPIVKGLLPKNMIILRQIYEAWPDLFKGTEAANAWPEKLTFQPRQQINGQLLVSVPTAALAVELTYNQTRILQTLNAYLGAAVIGAIRVQAYQTGLAIYPESSEKSGKKPKKHFCQEIDKSLDQISNPELRQALAAFQTVLDHSEPTTQTSKGDTHA